MFPTTNIFAISILLMTNMTQGYSEVLRPFPDDEGGIADNRLLTVLRRKSKSNLGLILGIGGGVVLAVVGAVVIWKFGFSESEIPEGFVIDQCAPKPCKNNGTCRMIQNSDGAIVFDCTCTEDWTGNTCTEKVPTCDGGIVSPPIEFSISMDLAFGAACKDYSECASRSCVEQKCAAVGYEGKCGNDADCSQGQCIRKRCRGQKTENTACQEDGECEPFLKCVEQICAARGAFLNEQKDSGAASGLLAEFIPIQVHRILDSMRLEGTKEARDLGPKIQKKFNGSNPGGAYFRLIGYSDNETLMYTTIISKKKNAKSIWRFKPTSSNHPAHAEIPFWNKMCQAWK